MQRSVIIAAVLLWCSAMAPALAGETRVPRAQQLVQHAEAAQQRGMPLILLVSLTDCRFCEHIRKQHLAPLMKSGAVVREIYLDRDTALVDFDQQPTTQRQFATRLGVRVAPTVFLFDANGVQVAKPIVGTMLDDFYGAYLDDAIATAKKALASGD